MPHLALIRALLPGLLILAVVAYVATLSSSRNKWKARAENCAIGRQADRTAYEQAQAKAKADNLARVAEVEAKQKEITHEVQSDLVARLERLRRELRDKAAGSPANPAGSPSNGQSRPGTPQASGVCLTPDQLLRAAENEERHDQLITWVEKQLGVKR